MIEQLTKAERDALEVRRRYHCKAIGLPAEADAQLRLLVTCAAIEVERDEACQPDAYPDGYEDGYGEGLRHGHAQAARGEPLPQVFAEPELDAMGEPKCSMLYREERDEAFEKIERLEAHIRDSETGRIEAELRADRKGLRRSWEKWRKWAASYIFDEDMPGDASFDDLSLQEELDRMIDEMRGDIELTRRKRDAD